MKKYFVLLSFIFAASNSGAESFLEMTKRKLEEAKKSLAQPQVAQPPVVQPQVEQPQVVQPQVEQPQVAQPQVAQPKDATSYCDAIINSAEVRNYTDKYELILSRGSALTSMGVNISLQKMLSSAFMRGTDDDLFSRSDALVRRINQAIPKQGEYAEDLNKEAVLERYLPWFSQCATKLKDSSLRYIFLDPGAPSSIINKFYNSSNEEKINLLRTSWKGGPMVGTRMNDRIFKENTGFQPRGINPYWVTPLLFAVSKGDPNLTPVTSQQITRLDKVIADLDSRVVTEQALQKQKADDKERELARLEREKEAEVKKLEELAIQQKRADQERQAEDAKPKTAQKSQLDKASTELPPKIDVSLFRRRFCSSIDVSLSAPTQFNYRKLRVGDVCEWSDDYINFIANQALNTDKVDLINLKEGYEFEKEMVSVGDEKFSYLYGYLNEFTNKFYIIVFKIVLCKTNTDNSLDAGNSFRVSLDAKYGKPSKVISKYDQEMDKVKAFESEIAVMRKKVITPKDATNVRDYEGLLNIQKNIAMNTPKDNINAIIYEYNSSDSAWNKANFPVGTVSVVTLNNLNSNQKKFASCKLDGAFELSFTGTKAMLANAVTLQNQREAIEKERKKKAPAPKLD